MFVRGVDNHLIIIFFALLDDLAIAQAIEASNLDQAFPRSTIDMTIFFRGLGGNIRVNILWQIACCNDLDNVVRKKSMDF